MKGYLLSSTQALPLFLELERRDEQLRELEKEADREALRRWESAARFVQCYGNAIVGRPSLLNGSER